jgi:hypothetical protein
MKVPFLSPRPSVPAPKPSTPVAPAPKPSVPAAKSTYTSAPPPAAHPHADRIAAAKAFLLNQPDPMAAKERSLSQLAAHLPPEDRHGVLAQVTAMRTAAKQKLMTDLETVSVQQLPADQKAQYLAVAQELKGSTDPVARLSLQTMLVDGKLDPKVLSGLNDLLKQPMADGIDRHQVLSDLVSELADPSNVRQGNHSTCGAVSTSMILLKENPAEYVRVVAGLSSPAGTVKLESGATLKRVEVPTRDDRSAVQQLVAPAMMAAAAPSGITYDGKHGYFVNADGKPVNEDGDVTSKDHALRRLPAAWTDRLLNRTLDGSYDNYDVGAIATDKEQAAALKVVLSAARREPVSVSVEGEAFGTEGLHRVVVLGVSEDKKSVRYLDPNGVEASMPADKFMQSIRRFSTDSLSKSERKTWDDRNGGFFDQLVNAAQNPAEIALSIVEGVTGSDDDGGKTTKPGGGTNG